MYIVLDGSVRLHQADEEITIASTREALGSWALFDDEPRIVTATVVEDCRLLRIERESFFDLLSDNVQITRSILKSMSARLRQLMGRVGPGSGLDRNR